MFKRIATIISILLIGLFVTAVTAHAAVSVRLQQPKSPTNSSSFNLIFVTLDTAGSPVTVKCYKKGPSDGAFSQFGSDIVVSSGGNTDNCAVNGSVINSEGTYTFKVTASNGSDPEATSNIVSVDVKTGGPGTPINYGKDKITACEYKIHFRSADDSGKTVKVEVYRSENKSFSADAGTRVGTIALGSNTDHDFVQSVPDCNKTYYYAVRAFDNAGNGSGLAGDSETVITTNTVNPTSAPQQQTGAIPVASANEESSVTDTDVEPTAEPTVSPASTGQESEEQNADMVQDVKGAATSNTSSSATWWYVIGGVVALALVIYLYLRRRHKIIEPHA